MLFLDETSIQTSSIQQIGMVLEIHCMDVSIEKNGVLRGAGNADASPATSTSPQET